MKMQLVTKLSAGIFTSKCLSLKRLNYTAMIIFMIIQAIDFFTDNTRNVGQLMRRIPQMYKVVLVHNAAPVSHHQGTALLHKAAKLLFKAVALHVEHGSYHKLVAVNFTFHVYEINGYSLLHQCTVMRLDFFFIAHSDIPRTL
ncbi:hypothetical protein D3C87_1410170 [compost metagenome]